MAVKIRLNRIGTKKRPYYRIVAIDSRAPRNGRHIEVLGIYDPMNLSVSKANASEEQKKGMGTVQLETERIQYWLKVGATPTPTVKTLLAKNKIKAA